MANYYYRFNDSFSIFARRKRSKRTRASSTVYLASLNQIFLRKYIAKWEMIRNERHEWCRIYSLLLLPKNQSQIQWVSFVARNKIRLRKKWDSDSLGCCQQIIIKLPEHLCKTLSSNLIACKRDIITNNFLWSNDRSVHTFQDYLSGVVCLLPHHRSTVQLVSR